MVSFSTGTTEIKIQKLIPLGSILLCGCLVFLFLRKSPNAEVPTEEGRDLGAILGPELDRSPARQAVVAELSEFDRWLGDYLSSPTSKKIDLKIVRPLAEARGKTVSQLIQSDPEYALEQALTWSEWLALPEEIGIQLREIFSSFRLGIGVHHEFMASHDS